MKRPFDHPRDMPTHVVCNLEVRDLPSLPRNLDWCYPELNMYAQTGLFPLHFQKQLFDYYNESISYMCDRPEDYHKVRDHFHVIDLKHGPPDDLDIPAQVRVNWGRWAHERTVNAGYQQEDSHKWLLERDLDWKILEKGNPPSEMRQQFDSPDGLFPQNWPEPDEPDEMDCESHLIAALVMDDYDNQVPSDQVFPNVPFRETLNAEGRIRESARLLGVQRAQLDTALTYAQGRAYTGNVQANERFVRHVPSEVQQSREAREVLLRVAPTEADVRTAAQLGIATTTMQVSIEPNVHPPVAEVSAPPFSGPSHKLEVETPSDSASSASAVTVPTASGPPAVKPTPKSPPPDILPSQPTSQPTSWISFNPSMVPDQPSPTMLMLMQEPDWLETQVAMLRDGPKPWFLPHEYGASPESTPSVPVLPAIPHDALAQDVDINDFATFAEWKEAMWSAPYDVARQAEVMSSYKPIPQAIIGFDFPVNLMSELAQPSGSH
eukprot:3798421-Amphidinium_carterae.1